MVVSILVIFVFGSCPAGGRVTAEKRQIALNAILRAAKAIAFKNAKKSLSLLISIQNLPKKLSLSINVQNL